MKWNTKLFFSGIWGIAIWVLSAYFSSSFVEDYYAGHVAKGGDPAFGEFGFIWLTVTFSIGLAVFRLGIRGVLPGTKY